MALENKEAVPTMHLFSLSSVIENEIKHLCLLY